MANVTVYVHPVDVKTYKNEYTKKLEINRFKESVRVNPLTCVYTSWKTTQYALPGMPMAQGLG